MGKGDRKTKKGKIAKGTFGVLRPHKTKTNDKPAAKAKPKKTTKKKTTAKK